MIRASFGLTETGTVREENQDNFLIDAAHGIFAVADGLGGLPFGARASRMTLDVLKRHLLRRSHLPLSEVVAEVNEEAREIGFRLDEAGFGTTLTVARYLPRRSVVEIAHVGDSAAWLVHQGAAQLLTVEHTVAARMVTDRWDSASEAIPPLAHHTLTQCIGQDPFIDPQIIEVAVQHGDRLFLFTDGVTKMIPEALLAELIARKEPLEGICQGLTFRVEREGSPDNYTVVGVEF